MADTTPRKMPTDSTYKNGRFANGQWFCKCNERTLPAIERISRTLKSEGEHFWRCRDIDGDQCNFFLWFAHVERAKQYMAEAEQYRAGAVPYPPQTPTHKHTEEGMHTPPNTSPTVERKRSLSSITIRETPDQRGPTPSASQPAPIPTPITQPNIRLGRDAAPRGHLRRSQEASPTPKRRRNISPPSDEDTELSATVGELLQSSQVHLNPSAEAELHHIINTTVSVFKTRIREHERTAKRLCQKLEEWEAAPSATGPST